MQNDLAQPFKAKMLIGGKWVGGDRVSEVRNPADPHEVVGSIVCGTPKDVDEAVAAAKAAQPAWGSRTFVERAKVLAGALDRISTGLEERGRLYARENGRVLAEATHELRAVSMMHRLTLELAPQLDAGRQLPAANGRTFVNYMPCGVVVSIIPWNAPVALGFLQAIPALLAGNSLVIKPPESCPLTLIESLGLIAEELPPGILNIVTGRSSDIGERLTTHPDVAKIGFTGGIPAARHIMANAAQTIKGITLELGGNDAAVLLEDVDLGEDTMKRMAHAVFAATGQVCMAIKRIYVAESVADRFLDAFTKTVDRYVVGDTLKPNVTMGPMHTRGGLEGALALIEDSKRRGAKVRELGAIDDKNVFTRGHFLRPAVVTEIADDAPLMVEEQFCPVIPIVTFRNVEDAIARANDSCLGLGASVWSAKPDQALSIARRMQAGTVFVNAHGIASVNRRAPYGGMKQSGIGRKSDIEGVLEYSQLQTITTYDGKTST